MAIGAVCDMGQDPATLLRVPLLPAVHAHERSRLIHSDARPFVCTHENVDAEWQWEPAQRLAADAAEASKNLDLLADGVCAHGSWRVEAHTIAPQALQLRARA